MNPGDPDVVDAIARHAFEFQGLCRFFGHRQVTRSSRDNANSSAS
jgi:hypothetical protein